MAQIHVGNHTEQESNRTWIGKTLVWYCLSFLLQSDTFITEIQLIPHPQFPVPPSQLHDCAASVLENRRAPSLAHDNAAGTYEIQLPRLSLEVTTGPSIDKLLLVPHM